MCSVWPRRINLDLWIRPSCVESWGTPAHQEWKRMSISIIVVGQANRQQAVIFMRHAPPLWLVLLIVLLACRNTRCKFIRFAIYPVYFLKHCRSYWPLGIFMILIAKATNFLLQACQFPVRTTLPRDHYIDVIMSAMASQTTGVSIFYSTVVQA